MDKLYFKVLQAGRSFHGGTLEWSLPQPDGNGDWSPGEWHEVEGPIQLCCNGLHLTCEPARWWAVDAACYLAQYEGKVAADEGDKIAVRRARLVRPATPEELVARQVYLSGRHEAHDGHAWAGGNSSVVARENSSVVAWENSSVVAGGNSSVVARGNSSVVARGNSSVVAGGNSSVVARENSSVVARENSSVVARENSSVVAWENSSVEAWENSSVEAGGNSSVVARENSSVVAWENSSVVAWENTSVVAGGNSSVVARGNSTTQTRDAWGQPTVEVKEYAVWIDRRSGKPVIHVATAEVANG